MSPSASFSAAPCAAPALAFVAGIFLSTTMPGRIPAVLAVCAFGLIGLARPWVGGRRRLLAWMGLALLCFSAGCWRMNHARERAAAARATIERSGVERRHAVWHGVLLRSAEPSWDGDLSIVLRGLPEGHTGEAVRLRVRIGGEAEDPRHAVRALRTGDTVRIWCRVTLPRPAANPGDVRGPGSTRRRGFDAYGSVKSAHLVERIGRGPGSLPRAIDRLRHRMRERLDRVFAGTPSARALAGALLLGDRALLRPEQQERFRDSGLAHLLAISGLHVGLFAAALAWLSFRLLPLRAGAGFLIVGLSAAAALVGARPPVLRAVSAAALAVAGRLFGRDPTAPNSLSVAALAIAAHDPWAVLGPGFQLSFAATAGIVFMTPALRRTLPLPRVAGRGLSLSLAAYAATAPLLAHHFGRVAPAAIGLNLVAVPLCVAAMGSAVTAVVGAGVPGLALPASVLAASLLDALERLAAGGAATPAWLVHPPGAALLVAHAIALVRAATSSRAAFVLALLLAWVHTGPPPRSADRVLLTVFDVGQAQSVLVRVPGAGGYLFDAAGRRGGRFDQGRRIVVPQLLRSGLYRLRTLALSHGHDDHAGGAASILRDFPVDELWVPLGWSRDERLRELVSLAVERNVAVRSLRRGDRAGPPAFPVAVLHPGAADVALATNDRSLAVLLGRTPNRAIIPGDLEREGERAVVAALPPQRAELLVVGHHGARRASTRAWLDWHDATLAVVSAGRDNRFGHPHPEALARLKERGTAVFRTDRRGGMEWAAGARGWQLLRTGRAAGE